VIALADFAEVWSDGYLAEEIGPRLTCVEADTLAHLLQETDHEDAAREWLIEHATQDDEGDSHHHLREETDEHTI
jgi:hypothetical protein